MFSSHRTLYCPPTCGNADANALATVRLWDTQEGGLPIKYDMPLLTHLHNLQSWGIIE